MTETITSMLKPSIHEKALLLRGQRSAVLANNLANVDTPKFKARDIDFKNVLQNEMDNQTLSMQKTHENHMTNIETEEPVELSFRTPSQPSIDGNTVEEHVEDVEYTKNMLNMQFSLGMVKDDLKGLISVFKGTGE